MTEMGHRTQDASLKFFSGKSGKSQTFINRACSSVIWQKGESQNGGICHITDVLYPEHLQSLKLDLIA